VPDVTSGSTPTTITVPSGYYYIDVTLNGGSGGTAYFQPDTYVGVSELETMCAGYRYLTSGGTANPLSTAWGTSGNTVTAMIPVTPGETLSFITGIGDANINAVDSDFGGGFTGVFAGSTPSASDVLALAAGGNAGSMPSAGDTLSDPYYLTTATSPISLAGASVYGYVNEYNLFGSATYYTCPTPLSNGYEFSIQSTTPGSAYGSYGGTYSSSQANYITSKALSSYTTTTNANNPGVGSATYAFYK
jgi:hypothetical protein